MKKYLVTLISNPFVCALLIFLLNIKLVLAYASTECLVLSFGLIGFIYYVNHEKLADRGFLCKLSVTFAIPYAVAYFVKLSHMLHSGSEPLRLSSVFVFLVSNILFMLIAIVIIALCAYTCAAVGGRIGAFVLKHISCFKKWIPPTLSLVLLVMCTNLILEQRKFVSGDFRQFSEPFFGIYTDWQVSPVGKNSLVISLYDAKEKRGKFAIFNAEDMQLDVKTNPFKIDFTNAKIVPVGLSDGRVLFIKATPNKLGSKREKVEKPVYFQAEIYDPATDTMLTASESSSKFMRDFGAIELLDGKVLIVESSKEGRQTFIYNPNTKKLSNAISLPYALTNVEMSLFKNGEVYISGFIPMREVKSKSGKLIYSATENNFREVSTKAIFPKTGGVDSQIVYPLNENEIAQVSFYSFWQERSPVVTVYNFKTNISKTTNLKALKKYNRMSTVLLQDEKILFIGGEYRSLLRLKYDVQNRRAYIYDIGTEKLSPIKEKMQNDCSSYKCLMVGVKNGKSVILSKSTFKKEKDGMIEVFVP